jgi:hypothetical protein
MVAGTRLTVIDVVVPSSPVEVGFLEMPTRADQVAVSGNHAYVVTDNWQGQSTLRVIDVSSPSSPTEMGSLVVQGGANRMAVIRGLAYLTSFGGLRVIDLGNPSSPHEVGSAALPDDFLAYDGVISGRYAYVLGSDFTDNRLYVFDTWGCTHPWQQQVPLAD